MTFERGVTDLGNLFVAGAVAAVLALWAWTRCSRLVAAVFVAGFGVMMITVAGLKLVSRTLSPEPDLAGTWALSSGAPSGHVAVATVVYGCAAALFLKAGRGWSVPVGALGAALAILGVAVTRVTLGTHTTPDVLAGLAVGLVFVAIFARALAVQGAGRRTPTGTLAVALAAVAVLALLSGLRISSERFL